MKAGAKSWNTDVAADANSASVPISDNKFREGLRAANVLIVEGAGSTIRIPLDQSRAAFDRLDNCLTKNSRALETNPLTTVTTIAYPTSRTDDKRDHAPAWALRSATVYGASSSEHPRPSRHGIHMLRLTGVATKFFKKSARSGTQPAEPRTLP